MSSLVSQSRYTTKEDKGQSLFSPLAPITQMLWITVSLLRIAMSSVAHLLPLNPGMLNHAEKTGRTSDSFFRLILNKFYMNLSFPAMLSLHLLHCHLCILDIWGVTESPAVHWSSHCSSRQLDREISHLCPADPPQTNGWWASRAESCVNQAAFWAHI